jgi:multidrug efflux pump subunit AcrA (membrane-fusion protein)
MTAGKFRWVALLSTVTFFLPVCVSAVRAQSSSSRGTVTGMTRPSEERKLSFSNPGVVQESPLKEGDKVKAGQVILALEDFIDVKEFERLKLQAESKARVEAAEADLRVKQAILKRKTDANKNGDSNAYGPAEMEEAENDVTLREKQLQVAKEDQMEAKIKADQQQRKVERLHLSSPIDGIIQRIVVNVGEWADPQSREGSVIVVKNDPVYVEVREVPARQVAMLQMGQKLKVRYPDQPDKAENWQDAEVFFFAPVAESVQTRLFKLRLSNPGNRPAGLEVIVKLPPDVVMAANAG